MGYGICCRMGKIGNFLVSGDVFAARDYVLQRPSSVKLNTTAASSSNVDVKYLVEGVARVLLLVSTHHQIEATSTSIIIKIDVYVRSEEFRRLNLV